MDSGKPNANAKISQLTIDFENINGVCGNCVNGKIKNVITAPTIIP